VDSALIILDCLRKDVAERVYRDALEERGFIYFDRAVAPAPWTLPSHASMLTGLYPFHHGAHERRNVSVHMLRVPKKAQRLLITNELLRKGVDTVLVTANPIFKPETGFTGFKEVHDVLPMFKLSDFLSEDELQRVDKAVRKHNAHTYAKKALALLREGEISLLAKIAIMRAYAQILRIRDRLFSGWPLDKGIKRALSIVKRIKWGNTALFMNLMELHEPYREKDWRIAYNRAAHYQKKYVLRIIDALPEDALVIVTSDHGQLLGEHGYWGHGRFFFDELIRVPLFIRFPKGAKVERKEKGWIPLTVIKDLLRRYYNGQTVSTDVLYKEYALSESFTIFEKLRDPHRYTYRVAVYLPGGKGVFDVEHWRWIEEPPDKETAWRILVKHWGPKLKCSQVL